MGYNTTKPLAINGFTNLMSALIAAGYSGDPRVGIGGELRNLDAVVNCYIHFANSNTSSAGLTGTDGIQFGTAAGTPAKFYTLQRGTDLSTVWLYSASAISVVAAIQG